MRNLFIDILVKEARLNEKIVLIVGDLGFNVVEPFKKEFPNRFFNAGVSEQSMIGIAAGLSMSGFKVFVYSIANFPTFRCAEQIRNDIDFHNLPVTIVSVGSGLGYGNLGYTHHGLQDYSLIRSLPNTLICSPLDNNELKSSLKYLFKNPQPSYLRLDKSLNIEIKSDKKNLYPGEWNLMSKQKNTKKLILSTGSTYNDCKKFLKKKELQYNWYSIPMWGMKVKTSQYKKLSMYNEIVTFENHIQDGGFGSWINEVLSVNKTKKKILVQNKFINPKVIGKVGSENYLNKLYGPK